MSRHVDLLRAAADALVEGVDPLGGAFLGEHGVTLDEACDLADLLAVGARLVAHAIENPRETVAAANGANLVATYEAISRLGREDR